ncbi:unnamed protein product, partial [Lampetra planeri]
MHLQPSRNNPTSLPPLQLAAVPAATIPIKEHLPINPVCASFFQQMQIEQQQQEQQEEQ